MQAKRLGWAVLSAVCVVAVLALFSGMLAKQAKEDAEAAHGLAPLQVIEIGEKPGEVSFRPDGGR